MRKIAVLASSLLMVLSCSREGEQVQMKNLNGTWNKKAEQVFHFNIKDAQKSEKHYICYQE